MMKHILPIILFWLYTLSTKAQSASEILHELERFNHFERVLYVAAHPDDENTRVISWLVNGVHAETAYLSLTRGDGGQNLIGEEFGDALGILRTNELMAARKIDGGKQYFTRAVDFGYSRSPEESFNKWGEEEILADVVWIIRSFRPHVIITRFPPDERGGHGHHTASAMLAIKASELAGISTAFPEQLTYVKPWQPQAVYWNTSSWWDKQVAEDIKTDPAIWMADIGGYNPLIGHSYNELGSLARSQHKCQGFGVDIQRGESLEYFRPLAGKPLNNGLKSLELPSWQTLNIPETEKKLALLIRDFNPKNPQLALPMLINIYKDLDKIDDIYLREAKKTHLQQIIVMCSGLFAEALTDKYAFLPGEKAKVKVNVLQRLPGQLAIEQIICGDAGIQFKKPLELPHNTFESFDLEVALPQELTNPHWLAKPHTNLYDIPQAQVGLPVNDPILYVDVFVQFDSYTLPVRVPVRYKWRDRVEGELQRNIAVVNPLHIICKEPMYLSLNQADVFVDVKLKWFADTGTFSVNFVAEGWKIEQPTRKITSMGAGTEQWLKLKMKPLNGIPQSTLKATVDGRVARTFQEIAYSHIDAQILMNPAEATLTNLNIKKNGTRVAYINGAGDRVAQAIQQMGYRVDILGEADLATANLSVYQAVILGIRAYNTELWLSNYSDKLMSYVQLGGRVIVQYNTASRFLEEKPPVQGPYPFAIGSNRVTEEDAAPNFLLPNHPVLNIPNKITTADFDGWVQERGLYFARDWDEKYAAPIAWHDTKLADDAGALIIGDYGKGAFIYTGISFFRQLPAGVPGAYRLFANIISYQPKK